MRKRGVAPLLYVRDRRGSDCDRRQRRPRERKGCKPWTEAGYTPTSPPRYARPNFEEL
jgi:hypothetical protein